MSYGLSQYIPANPATGLIVGQEVSAWIGSRFSPVNTPPATNGSPPSGSPDYGPTATTSISGCAFTVTTTDEFILSVYDPADTSNGGSYNTYWYGPYLIDPSTNLKGWTAAVDQSGHREVSGATTITAGSNGAVLPQSTIHVGTTTGMIPTGTLGGLLAIADNVGGIGTFDIVAFTGTSGGNTFTGCTGGSGTLATNQFVFPAYKNGNYRRTCFVCFQSKVTTTGDAAETAFYSTLGGIGPFFVTAAGFAAYNVSATILQAKFTASFVVDPGAYYFAEPLTQGSGTVFTGQATGTWVEVDF